MAEYRTLLLTYLRPQLAAVSLLALLLFANIGLQLVNPQIVRSFIDAARSTVPLDALTNTALLFIGVVLVSQLVAVAVTYVGENVGWNATNRLREDLALHCLRLPLSFHTVHTPGELIGRVDGDVAALSNFFSRFVIQIVGNTLLLVGVVLISFLEDWRIGALFSCFALVALIVLGRMRRIAVPAFKAHRQGFAELSSFWEERLTGTEDIRASGAIPYTLRRHYDVLGNHMRNARTSHVMARVMQSATEFLLALGTAAAFALGAYVVGAGAITVGTLYLVFAYTNILAWNLLQITQQMEDLQQAVAAAERIRELYNIRNPLDDGQEPGPVSGPPAVEFRAVSFAYAAGAPILNDLSFQLAPGASLGLLGRTGSGKTTLIRLLFRFYDPLHGAILLDGVDLRRYPLKRLRQRMGIVTQDVQLFHATLRDNLTLFAEQIPDDRILEVINQLGLSPWYAALPGGLDAVLSAGEGGLSAGEAQLLACARVFLREPDLVILDEASSRLDPATEELVGRAIERLLQGRTSIIIAHRLQTVQRVDTIMILERGRVVEHGDRDALQSDPRSRFARLLRAGIQEALA